MSSEFVKNVIVKELFLMILRTGTSSCRVPLIQLHVSSCCNVWQPVDLGNIFGCGGKLLQDIIYDNPGPPGPCVVECLLERQKILVNGVLNTTNLKENWKMPYSICWEAVTGYVKSLNVSFQDCDPFPYYLDLCTQRLMLDYCPTNRWKNSTLCNAVRAVVRTCSIRSLFG